MGFWDGTASRQPTRGKGDWDDFARLQPDARMVTLRHELAPYFQVTQAGANLSVWFDAGRTTPLLTLTPPTVADQQRDLRHVRTAADLRAERIGEIVAQQGDMLSFYGSEFYLHPDRKKWTLVLMSALYEAVIVPEMRLKLYSSSPRPMEFSTLVQPIIATPSHSAYPSGHATEAFAFAGLLALLELVAKGVADPVAALTTALKGPAKALEMLPFRLAARIADNRTIAGVHFPVDSAHGALLGVGCATAFYALGAQSPTTLGTYAAKAGDWTDYFDLGRWSVALKDKWPAAGNPKIVVPAAAASGLLAQLWAHAVAEWKMDFRP